MDLLDTVMRELRFESAAYRWLELGTPFQVGFDQPGLRGVHIVARGECELALEPRGEDSGSGNGDGDAEPVRLATGDLVILPRGDSHVLRSPDGGRRAARVSGFELAMRTPGNRLHIGGADTVVVCGAFLIGEPDHPVLYGLPRVIHVPGHAAAWLAPFVEVLRAEAFAGGRGSELVMARLSDAMLVRALRHHSDTVDRPGWLAGLADPCLTRALDAMHGDLAHPWTVAALARTAGLSRAAFSARFTAQVGRPVMRYLLAVRMQRARTLLRDRRATVAAVAAQVGYQSDLAFAAAFKRETGTSPGAYRTAATRREDTTVHPGPG
ncbi:AraC family transcriptional regulator [Planobispora rosea]|uniref:AraC family transcriptional regulator n=1 Tax=Planobispora rosea TaxID=35762 RepID=UPI000AE50E02|nr:AraC family transcriptional regulator [Planobispora rosea]